MKIFSKFTLLALLVAVACTTNAWAGYADVILADNPVAYYTFDNVSGTTVPNLGSSGTTNDGTISGNLR